MARRYRTLKHQSKKRTTRKQRTKKQHRGGSKLVPLLSRYTSSLNVPEPVEYSAANKKRMEELRKYYAELNRKENEERARKEKEAAQQKAYEVELQRTSPLQELAQQEAAELAIIERKFKEGKFIPVENVKLLQNQLEYLKELEERGSRLSNPRSVATSFSSTR